MPLTVSYDDSHANQFTPMQAWVREELELPADTAVSVEVTHTQVALGAIKLVLPFGIADIQNKIDLSAVRLSIKALLTNHMVEVKVKAPAEPVVQKAWDEMTDEEWIEAAAGEFFPNAVDLHKATAIHQRVHGTSGGSVYRVCMLGPELQVACRVHGNKISFRATSGGKAPSGDIAEVLKSLGVTNFYDDRCTVHVHFNKGPDSVLGSAEYRSVMGAFYAALRPWVETQFPSLQKLREGVK